MKKETEMVLVALYMLGLAIFFASSTFFNIVNNWNEPQIVFNNLLPIFGIMFLGITPFLIDMTRTRIMQ